MNWTPGPWKIDTDTQGYVVIVAGQRTICAVGPEEDPTSETDAAAIVLLPELAEALKAALAEMDAFQKYWTSPNMNLKRSESKAQETARALLAKLEAKP